VYVFTEIEYTGVDTVRLCAIQYYCGAATRLRTGLIRLVYPSYDMHAYILKGTVCTQTVSNTKGTRAHTHRELIYRGASRATKGQEALWAPVLKARRRHRRQHLHRCRKCQRRRHRTGYIGIEYAYVCLRSAYFPRRRATCCPMVLYL